MRAQGLPGEDGGVGYGDDGYDVLMLLLSVHCQCAPERAHGGVPDENGCGLDDAFFVKVWALRGLVVCFCGSYSFDLLVHCSCRPFFLTLYFIECPLSLPPQAAAKPRPVQQAAGVHAGGAGQADG